METEVKIDLEELCGHKFNLSYDQPLMDIAGNTLDVKMVMQDYDPQSDRMVAEFLDKKIPQYLPPPDGDREPMVFKFDTQAEFEECLPKHTPKLREIKPRDVTFHHRLISTEQPDRLIDIEAPKRHTEQQPSPLIDHRSPPSISQSVLRTL